MKLIDPDTLPAFFLLGIPAIRGAEESYRLGHPPQGPAQDLPDNHPLFFGQSMTSAAREIVRVNAVKACCLDARQFISNFRAADTNFTIALPEACRRHAPATPNVWSDGTVQQPASPFALAGYGVWHPARDVEVHPHTVG